MRLPYLPEELGLVQRDLPNLIQEFVKLRIHSKRLPGLDHDARVVFEAVLGVDVQVWDRPVHLGGHLVDTGSDALRELLLLWDFLLEQICGVQDRIQLLQFHGVGRNLLLIHIWLL